MGWARRPAKSQQSKAGHNLGRIVLEFDGSYNGELYEASHDTVCNASPIDCVGFDTGIRIGIGVTMDIAVDPPPDYGGAMYYCI